MASNSCNSIKPMLLLNHQDYFQKSSTFKLTTRSLIIFFVAAFLAWELQVTAQTLFYTSEWGHFIIRTTAILISDIFLVATSYWMLKRNNISYKTLGLNLSKHTLISFLIGSVIGIVTIFITAFCLRLIIPYHFAFSSLNTTKILRECYSYLLGALLEELIFRGYLVIVLSQLLGWRLSLLIMALPFGLFHLQGGHGGLSIVISTTLYSFIFGFSFILTRSLWSAVAAHASVNVLLHVLTGLDGGNTSVYHIVFDKSLPNSNNILLISMASVIIICLVLYSIIHWRQRKQLA